MNRLKELRIKHDKTQKDIADFLNVTPKAISFYELGQRDIPIEALQKLADFFHVSTDEILGREPKGGFYVNAETAEIANALKEGDGMLRVMFDTVRKLPPEKMREAANYIEYLKAKQHPEEE